MSNMENFSREYQPPKIPSHWTAEERRYAQAVTDVLDDIYLRYGRLNKKDLSGTLSKEITDASGNISTLQQLADSIKLEVSNTKIYRYPSEAELLAALTIADIDMAVGLLWLDTTNNLMKRCSAVSPLTWENVQADEVHTSYIDILGSLIKLYSGGKIEMVSGSTIDMLAGSFFKLLSGSGSTAISLDNSRADGAFLMLGGATPEAAPFVAYNDGTIKNVANTYVQTAADNADATHGIVMDVFFPADVTLVDKVLLSCKFAAFRAYETGAASGGGSTSGSGGGQTSSEDAAAARTSRNGGGSTESSTSSGSGTTGASADLNTDYNNAYTSGSGGSGNTGGSSVSISGSTGYKDGAGSHNHPVGTLSGGSHTHSGPSHTHTIGAHTHNIGSHSHSLNNHTHSVTIPSHTHIVDIPAHSHTVADHTHTTPNHTHGITYGIYEGTTPTTCTVYVDGTAVAALTNVGPFINADIANAFLKSGGKIVRNAFHTVEIRPNTLGRISAHLYVKTTQVSKVAGTL